MNTITMKRIGLAVATLALACGASVQAQAPDNVDTYQFRGLAGYGGGYQHDSCTVRSVYFAAYQNTTHEDGGGQPVTSDRGYVAWYSFNRCAFTYTSGYAFGNLDISGNFNLLTASGSLSGWQYGTGAVTVGVNLTFDAAGNYVSRGESTYSFSSPYLFSHSRYEGTYSDATVSGSVTIGSTNLLDGLSQSYATLSQANSGSVRLYRSPDE
jgi:hypothetical protein